MDVILKLFFLILVHYSSVKSETNLTGRPCVTGGKPGRCTPWRQCLTLAFDKIYDTRPGICSYNDADPIVCCTSCSLVEDVSKAVVIVNAGKILWKNNQKSWNKCVGYAESLPYRCKDHSVTVEKEWSDVSKCHCVLRRTWSFVLGGRAAERAEYPHMALLGYGPGVNNEMQWVCSGSVISERFILTAGHCLSTSTRLPVSVAALGILKRSDPEELWQKYSIQERIPHPEYRPPSKFNDIALLKTENSIIFNDNVLPACLPRVPVPDENRRRMDIKFMNCDMSFYSWDGTNDDGDEPYATAVGWGATGHREQLSDTLQSVQLEMFNSSSCSALYGPHRHLRGGYNHSSQMCYGNTEEMKDTCDGDSGGPLQVGGELHCQYKIIGVTSFGRPCGLQAQAGVYTRVLSYVPWVESVVWPET